MFGHGSLPVDPDLPGAVGLCAGAEVLGAVDLVVDVEVDGVVAAPAIPAAAPPVASAPATIVAPSVLEMCIGVNLLGMSVVMLRSIMGWQAAQRLWIA
jgi:hypothetical protein